MSDVEPKKETSVVDRYRSASFVFLALFFVKLFAFLGTIRTAVQAKAAGSSDLVLTSQNRAAIAAAATMYIISAFVALAVSRGLANRMEWAKRLGLIYAIIQILGIFLVMQLGMLAVINLILGIMGLLNIHLAHTFERNPAKS